MTTYNRTITLDVNAVTITQDFGTNDSVVVTVNATSVGSNASASITVQSGDVAVSASNVSIGSSFTITGISPGTYSIYLFYYDKTYGSQQGYVQGNFSQGEIFPASPSAFNQTVGYTATSASVPIYGGVTTAEAYSLCVTPGLTTNVQVVDDRISAMTPYNGGNFTISSGELPAAGASRTYYIYSYRYPAYGGAGQYYYASSFTVTRNPEPVTTPTDITFAAATTASPTTTVTVGASGGSGGTLQVSLDNVNWFNAPASGTLTRGDPNTFYARRVGVGGSVSGTYSENYTVPYLTPDLGVSATSSTIAYTGTSATTTVSGVARTSESVAVRVNNGSTDLATRTSNGSITFSSSLPAAGNTVTYEIFTRRATSTGGDGETWYGTNDTFTVTRLPEPVTTPTNLSFEAATTPSATTTVTVTASGGSGGTLQVSQDNVNWFANGSSGPLTRGDPNTFYARRVGEGGSVSGIYSEAYTVPYLTPDLGVSATSSTIAFAATSASTTVSGVARSSESVAVRNNNGFATLGTREGNGSITFSDSLPAAGASRTYEIFTRRATSAGGDGETWYATNDTFTVTRNPAPSISTNKSTYADGEAVTVSWSTDYLGGKYYNSTGDVQVGNNRFDPKEGYLGTGFSGTFTTTAVGPSSGSWTGGFSLRLGSVAGTVIANSNTVTINAPAPVVTAPTNISFSAALTADEITGVTVTAEGGTNGTMQVSSNGSTWVANGTTFSRTRGTTQTWYARTVGTTTSGNYTESYTVPYLTGFDNSITIGSYTSTISSSNTSNVSVPYTNGGSPDQYRIRSNNTVGGSWLDTRNGASNTFIVEYASTSYTGTELPSNGQTFTYFIEGRRRGDTGGDPNGAWSPVSLSNYASNTFTITRSNADTTPADFNLGGPAVGVGINILVYSNTITVGGINAPANISISGTGSPAYSINGGTYTSSSGTVTNGQTVQVRVTSSGSSNTSVTATLNIGGVTDTFTATTAGAGEGGEGVNDPSGATYGLECRASNGTSVVFSPNKRFTNSEAIEISGTVTIAADAYSVWIKSKGCHDVTRGRILIVGFASFYFEIETRSTNDGEFRVRNTTSEPRVLEYVGITYG